MDEKLKLAAFVTIFFIAIFSTDFLDKSLKSLIAENEWWNLVVSIPLLIVTIGMGFLTLRIKSLIKFAFFGAICLFIFIATQIYFIPDENKMEWDILKQSWVEVGVYFGVLFSSVFLVTLIFLSVGRVFKYIYDLFFVASKSEVAE